MSKKNKKKNHRSKASRKRRAACKADPRIRDRQKKKNKKNRTKVLYRDVRDPNTAPIDEMPCGFPTKHLGSANEPGFFALLLVRHAVALQKRIMNEEPVKSYSLIEFSMSEMDAETLGHRQEITPVVVGTGQICLHNMELILSNRIDEIAIGIEESVRDIVAQFNEDGPWTVRTIFVEASLVDDFVDPSEGTRLSRQGAGVDKTYVKEVTL